MCDHAEKRREQNGAGAKHQSGEQAMLSHLLEIERHRVGEQHQDQRHRCDHAQDR